MSSGRTIVISSGRYAMEIDPTVGASVRNLRWNGIDIFRSQSKAGVLESGYFPLVPFCNRIAGSAFVFAGQRIVLTPNHPTVLDDPVLHGNGWLSVWRVEAQDIASATFLVDHDRGEWPWRFRARHSFTLDGDGLAMSLEIANRSDTAMPVGLGFHPFFPRDETTIVHALHHGERQADGSAEMRKDPIDWWIGKTIGSRIVDTTYIERRGEIRIEWPDRGLGAALVPGPRLPFTHVYVPAGESYFCVEPVSHLPEAFPTEDPAKGWQTLVPGEMLKVSLRIRAYPLASP